jgi:hypothetical protein
MPADPVTAEIPADSMILPGVEQIQASEQSNSNADELAEVPIHAIITRPISICESYRQRTTNKRGRPDRHFGLRTLLSLEAFPQPAQSFRDFAPREWLAARRSCRPAGSA